MATDDLWSYFDRIYCINLTDREDRRASAQKIFDEHDIPATFYLVERHPTSPVQGCFESHVQIIEEAYQKNYQNILIFEDDIVATNQLTVDNVASTINFLRNNDKWELFFYSMEPDIVFYRSKRVTGNIRKVHAYWGTAYALSRRAIEKYHNLRFTGTPIDLIYVKNQEAYGHWWSMFTQSNSPSDLREHAKERSTDSPSVFEQYSKNVNIPIIYLIPAVFIVILFGLTSLGVPPNYQILWLLIGCLIGLAIIVGTFWL